MIDTAAIGPVAALIAGFAGSAYCLAMCGGMASALALKAQAAPVATSRSLALTTTRQLARVSGYAVAGALCGAAGGTIQLILDLARVGTILRVASGILLLLLAVRLLLHWNAFARIERLGAKFWSLLRPLATYGANANGVRQALTLGFLWGWLPCGLVYSILLLRRAAERRMARSSWPPSAWARCRRCLRAAYSPSKSASCLQDNPRAQ